jgi:hypothetical protein
MGVRILANDDNSYRDHVGLAALYCSTSDWAFGPVFYDAEGHSARERAEAFCRWLGNREPRRMSDQELEAAYAEWRAQEADQWTAETHIEVLDDGTSIAIARGLTETLRRALLTTFPQGAKKEEKE